MADKKTAIKGGLNIAKRLLADGEELTAAQRAEAGRKAAELIKTQPQVKASEALGQQMEKGMKRTTTTQSDRTRVGGGNIGGAPFSAISEADPAYKGKVWGVMDEGTAARLKNLTDEETAWTTMLGSASQLKTNPIVFDKLKRGFIDSMKQGNLSPELAGKINHNLELTFGKGADIRDPKIWRQADTFDKRAALADVMMGQGTAPSKGGIAIGGEKSGKGVIFKPTDILKRETEPSLLHTEHGGDVPTFAAGPRLFRIEKESEYRPDLHPGYPTLLRGKDLGVNMMPTPTEVYLPDWHKRFKQNNPERKGPGYYDLALGVKGEGLPSQDLNDEYIRHLLREGFKKGGKVEVDIDAADRRLAQAMAKRMSGGGMAKGGKVDIAASDARLEAAINARMGMAEGGAVGFKKIQFMDKGGKVGKLASGIANVGKRLLADSDVLPTAEREANLAKMLSESKVKNRLYHGTTKDVKKFDQSQAGKKTGNLTTALGTFLSDSPKEASRYAKDWGAEGGNVMPVFAQLKNPYEMPYKEFDNLAMGAWNRRMNDPDYDPNSVVKVGDMEAQRRAAEALSKHEAEALQDVMNRREELMSQGYDSIMVKIGGNNEIIVFDPTKIKSATGNRGTYDTNEPDITKAEGGPAFKKLEFMADGGKLVKGAAKLGKRLLADPEKKIIEPPSIIIPSKIGKVKEAVRQREGDYGAKRVERAADEIPNLDKMYQEEALRRAFSGDNARALMTLDPKDFEKYAMPIPMDIAKNKMYFTDIDKSKELNMRDVFRDSNLTDSEWMALDNREKALLAHQYMRKYNQEEMNHAQYLKHLAGLEDGFDEVPFLQINKQEQGLPLTPFISGHEGRHRNRALAGRGEEKNLIQLLPRAELREPFPRRSQEEYIEALKKELEMTGGMVRPESEEIYGGGQIQQIMRKPIALPDVYAEGGAAFKKLQFMDKGGITTSAGTFSPEDLGVNPSDIGISDKRWNTIKRNAAELFGEGKEQLEKEYRQLGQKGGKKDFAIRVGSQLTGGVPDLINLGLEGVDLIQGAIPSLSKPESVLGGSDRIPKFRLASDEPWLGSAQFMRKFKEAQLLGENEFPLTELAAGFAAPAAAVGVVSKGKQAYKGAKSLAKTSNKRRGGLTAMAR